MKIFSANNAKHQSNWDWIKCAPHDKRAKKKADAEAGFLKIMVINLLWKAT